MTCKHNRILKEYKPNSNNKNELVEIYLCVHCGTVMNVSVMDVKEYE